MINRHETLWSLEPLVREVARLARAVWRRRWAFGAAAALPLVAAVLYVAKAPDRYAGKARIIVGDQGNATALTLTPQLTPKSNELENQLEMIKSHEVIARAAALGCVRYPSAPPTEDELNKTLTVKPLKETDIIEVSAEAKTAARAAALANLAADAYLEAHVRDRRKKAAAAKTFIEKQLEIYENRLGASEDDLETYKRTAGVISVPTETDELIKADAAFAQELAKTRVNLAAAETKQLFLEDELRITKEGLLATATDVSSPVARHLQDKLITLEYRYANLILKGYDPGHAELAALAEEIGQTRRKLAEEAATATGTEPAVNPFAKIENLAADLDTERAEVVALRAQERELLRESAGSASRLATLPQKENTLMGLQRDKQANESLYMLLLERREEARISEASEFGSARLLSRALPPAKPFAPRRTESLLWGLIAGILLGSAAVAAVEYFDRTVKTAAAARDIVGAPVLGLIPTFRQFAKTRAFPMGRTNGGAAGDAPKLPVVVRAPKSPIAESFRTLYAQVFHIINNNGFGKSPILGITSATSQEGKSTIISNLAAAFAQFGVRTVLIDADLERSTVGRTYGVEGRPGVADFLRGDASWEGIATPSAVPNLTVVSAGTNAPAASTLLATRSFRDLIGRARDEAELVLLDVPPVFPVADVALVAGAVKEFLFVVRAGNVGPQELDRAVRTLKQVGGEILGVVLNCAEPAGTYGYGYYRYYYYHRRGRKPKEVGSIA